MSTFSSSVVPSACVTWRSHDLPKMVTTGGPASTSAWILLSSCGRTPGRRVEPKARDLGGLEDGVLDALEEAQVLGVRARPATLDVVDAEGVEPLGDADLVLHGEGHAFALRAVAQRRVVNLDFPGHGTPIIPLLCPGCQVHLPISPSPPSGERAAVRAESRSGEARAETIRGRVSLAAARYLSTRSACLQS